MSVPSLESERRAILLFGALALAAARPCAAELRQTETTSTVCTASSKVYVETDAELNHCPTRLMGKLPNDARAYLKQTQIAWIDQRNGSCSRKIDSGFFVNPQLPPAPRADAGIHPGGTRDTRAQGASRTKL